MFHIICNYRVMKINEERKRIIEAIAAHLAKVSTEEDERLIDKWKHASHKNELVLKHLVEEGRVEELLDEWGKTDVLAAWRQIEQQVKGTSAKRRFMRTYLRYAAVFVGLAIVSVLLVYTWNGHKEGAPFVENQQLSARRTGAQLMMADGSVITIDESGDSTIQVSGGTTIYKEASHLDYSRTRNSEDTVEVFNEMRTLNGMEYVMTLADGTRVHLNAESRLRYPVNFVGKNRVVECEGEAYFDVVKDSAHPFIVKSGNMEVMVLGTKFNLRAYRDEATYETTLIEGSVRVTGKGEQCEIDPGEQAVFDHVRGNMISRKVDVALYTSWMNADIQFRDMRLENLMRNLARWYGVKYQFVDEEAKDVELGGCINRYEDMKPILDMLRRTELVHVVYKNNVVYISIKK